jgi:hypothetical protein
MEKEQIIEEIKKIIVEVGGFGIGEVEEDGISYSPCVNEMGNFVALAEEFNLNEVEVNVYNPNSFSSDPIDDYTLTYEELDKDVLEEILALCEQYKESQEEE